MRNIMKRLLLYVLLSLPMLAQADLLDDILDGKYNAQSLSTQQQDSILNAANASSESACRYRLEYENKQKIYRHSFVADYYLVDTQRGTRVHLSDGPVRDAALSPNGKYVVYAKGKDLYIYKTDFSTEIAITNDETEGRDVFNGISDWLYEEEFGITRMFAFSPDSKQLAFVRLDETHVPEFAWQEYVLDDKSQNYPILKALRYPKAGEINATASVCVYDILYKGIRTMQIDDCEDAYLPRIVWAKPQIDPKTKAPQDAGLNILKVNRDQTQLEVLTANTKSTVCRLLYKEQSDKYFMDYELFDQWQWLADGRFIVLSEREGWRRAYLHSAQGAPIKTLTPAAMDITRIYGVDEAQGLMYYQVASTPLTRQVMMVDMRKGENTPLTTTAGTHDARFSNDMKRYIDCFQSVAVPNIYTLYTLKNGKPNKGTVVLDNAALQTKWNDMNLPKTEFITIPTERGDTLDAYVILPAIEPGKRYPVVVLQYSGPASQRVLNRWRKRWGTYLATQGYIVVNADPRGTDCRGRQWRNETYMLLGQKEAQDHISVANYMASLPYVDSAHMCMCGWSYGGYQTIRTMSEPNSPFCCGIAIAPVTDWRLYDSGYTERYMRRPMVNENGYSMSSLLPLAEQLQGKLLLIHGTADDNVHAQNAWLYADALVQAGKQFEMQMYVDDNHHLKRANNYRHLHRRLMLFLNNQLKTANN